jgi:hypothetical protein
VVVHVMMAEVSVAGSRVGPLKGFQGPALSLPAGGWAAGTRSYDGADQVDRITDGAIPLSVASYKGTAVIGRKCLGMSANIVCALPSAGSVVMGGKVPVARRTIGHA